ncbi:MAG: histidine phosphatase family protein [Legionella sp.]|uniref:histidine phosphatase family protein n=1 Tax=Legionella sp. TaxID=459 RepID=UPI002848A418|nr:histidine phosphatase family protein [Legionella sp.]
MQEKKFSQLIEEHSFSTEAENAQGQIKKFYFQSIEEIINKLSQVNEEEKGPLLKQLKEVDQGYLNAQKLEIMGHVLFSRHGKSAIWAQKRLGMSPNATIAASAESSMSQTNQVTGNLLFYPEHHQPFIAISPMNRAMQTAGLLIPENICEAEISIEPALTENSSHPSGCDVRSTADMKKIYETTSFWREPLKVILWFFSMLFCSQKDFDNLYEKRKQALENIKKHGFVEPQVIDERIDVKQDLDYAGDKVEEIKRLIEKADGRDCWFFGHGKNFQTFFADLFGIKSIFAYAETRSVYKTRNEQNEVSLFTPPYVLQVNQETGAIEGKFTASLGISTTLEQTKTSLDSSRPISLLGGPIVQNTPQVDPSSKERALPSSVCEIMEEQEESAKHRAGTGGLSQLS